MLQYMSSALLVTGPFHWQWCISCINLQHRANAGIPSCAGAAELPAETWTHIRKHLGAYLSQQAAACSCCSEPLLQIAYCEEKVECRRVMLLAHFGETGFNTALCKPACDICASNVGQAFEDRDMSSVALDVVRLVRAMGQRFSLTHVLDVFRGSNSQAVRRQQHESLAEGMA